MMKTLGVCLAAVLCLTACPAEETNNGADAGNNDPINSNPAECPSTPPESAGACATDGLACVYSLECPCGPRENFTWTCSGGQFVQPSLTCTTGAAASCVNNTPTDMNLPDGAMPPADMAGPPDMASPPDLGVDVGVDMPAPRLEAHGCTYATALDQTGNADVVISDLIAWDLAHNNVCIRVDAGTNVTWNGNFTNHPLDGGVSPTENANSPIDIAGAGAVGDDTVVVTLTLGGDYPYFCGIHTGLMRGVVYVD